MFKTVPLIVLLLSVCMAAPAGASDRHETATRLPNHWLSDGLNRLAVWLPPQSKRQAIRVNYTRTD